MLPVRRRGQRAVRHHPGRTRVLRGRARHTEPGGGGGRRGHLELEAAWRLASRDDGHTLLARTIRYIEDRRREEHRSTGAIEQHRSPLGVVWGALDPVAVAAMAHRLAERRPDARLTVLDGVGDYPMLEAPARFADAAPALLA